LPNFLLLLKAFRASFTSLNVAVSLNEMRIIRTFFRPSIVILIYLKERKIKFFSSLIDTEFNHYQFAD